MFAKGEQTVTGLPMGLQQRFDPRYHLRPCFSCFCRQLQTVTVKIIQGGVKNHTITVWQQWAEMRNISVASVSNMTSLILGISAK